MTLLPQDLTRRSFLYRELESAGAAFEANAKAPDQIESVWRSQPHIIAVRGLALHRVRHLRRCQYPSLCDQSDAYCAHGRRAEHLRDQEKPMPSNHMASKSVAI